MNFPTKLTVFRLSFSPLIFPALLYCFLTDTYMLGNIVLALIFLAIGFTDFLDGYYARAYNQVSFLGSFLDPLADKFLVFSTLITLVALHKVCFYTAIILIGREFYVMGLRELALSYGCHVPVIWSAKVKTFLQIIYIALVILNIQSISFWFIKCTCAILTILVSCYSAFLYSRQLYTFYSEQK